VSKQHPADEADIEKIAQATHFTIHLRSGPHDKITKRAKTLVAAVRAADKLGKTGSGKKPMIYAVTDDRMTVHVPAAMIAQARQEIEQKAAADHKSAREGVEALARTNADMFGLDPATGKPKAKAGKNAGRKVKRATGAASGRPVSRRAEIAENAAKGVLPPAPDFSAETHRRFRGKLAEIVALVEVGDVAALKAIEIKAYSSSPKAMDRYRNFAVLALEAQTMTP
jgi:hypothetical protein